MRGTYELNSYLGAVGSARAGAVVVAAAVGPPAAGEPAASHQKYQIKIEPFLAPPARARTAFVTRFSECPSAQVAVGD